MSEAVAEPQAPFLSTLRRDEFRFAAVLVVVLTALRFWAAAFTGLNPDEAYYWYWSRYLAASYYDHPPMVAYLMRVSTDLLGNAPFGVRFLSMLLIIPISAAAYWTGRLLFGRAVGLRGMLWLNATILVGVGGLIATPDMPSVLFWSVAIAALAMTVRSGRGAWWLVVGLAAGLGVLSKLTDLFLAPGLFLAVIVDRDLRRWLPTPWPWLGVAAALLVLAPMIRWNIGHDWVTFVKQLGRAEPSRFYAQGLPEYLGGLYLLLNPAVAMFAILAIVRYFRHRLIEMEPGLRLLLLTSLPLLAYFAVHALFARVQGNWPGPVYPSLALMAAVAAERAAGAGLVRLRAAVVPVGFVVATLGLVAFANPYGLIPPSWDPAKVMHGWDRFAGDVAERRQQSGARWIAAANYSINAVLVYYLRDAGIPIWDVTEPVRYAFAPPADPNLRAEPALLASDKPFDRTLHSCFAKLTPVEPEDAGRADQDHQVFAYLAEGPMRGLLKRTC
jgi:4-amino-4-deoxy-L-arabinose transferase-like glycosyltransferase